MIMQAMIEGVALGASAYKTRKNAAVLMVFTEGADNTADTSSVRVRTGSDDDVVGAPECTRVLVATMGGSRY